MATEVASQAASTAVVDRLGVPQGEGRSLAWWGIVATIMTEGMLFAMLLFVYYYLYGLATEWPLGEIEPPEMRIVTVRTVLLFASSATMSLADRAIEHGRQDMAKLGLLMTFVLGAVFLAGHVDEMIKEVEKFTWTTNAYGSLFYVIVNFHAAHLTIGLLFIAFTLAATMRGHYSAHNYQGFKVTAMYWHFVDVIWVFVFPTLYLLPNLAPNAF